MGTAIKLSKPENQGTRSMPYKYRRRVSEVQSPCQWLNHCYDGKCPSFTRIHGNHYCARENITQNKTHYLFSYLQAYVAMPRALVFINTRSDANTVVQDLQKVEGISEVHSSKGMYDAVAMVQADSLKRVSEIISYHIRKMDEVKATLTLTLIENPAT